MGNIFLSYRRQDTQDVVGRVYDRLCDRFGAARVFKDVDSIPPAVNFRTFIAETIRSSEIVLLAIGERWLTAAAADGSRRINDPNDFVRIEIETALAAGVPILPLLIDRAEMPDAADLPPSMAAIADWNAIRVRPDPDFGRDIDRLIGTLRRRLDARRRLLKFLTVGLAPVAVVLMVAVLFAPDLQQLLFDRSDRPNDLNMPDDGRPVTPPDLGTYYQSVAGLKSADLKRGLARLTRRDHRVISYTEAREHIATVHEDAFFPGKLRAYYDDSLVPVDSFPKGWNREHIWPRSYGYSRFETARADLHNMVAADPMQNSRRSNLPFTDDPLAAEAGGFFLVEESSSGDIRGDLARILFYMAVRYEGVGGDPDLELTDEPLTVGTSRFGPLSILLRWHEADPVSVHEREVNDRVYAIQGNRNPFVDHPDLIRHIWPHPATSPE